MTDDLYARDMLRAASDTALAGRLEARDATATLDNPFCGDRVTYDVVLDAGRRIAELRHEVKACLLCQASATLLSRLARGRTGPEVEAMRRRLLDGLKSGSPRPLEEAPDYDMFASVGQHRSRISCVVLPFETLAKAAGG